MKFDKDSYYLFRQQIGQEIFRINPPFEGKKVCVALSGGLDSSCVLAMFSKLIPDIRTYSIGFKDSNEFEKASLVANHFKTKHKNIVVSKKKYEDECKRLIKLKGRPLQLPNEAFLYLIAKEFKKEIGDREGIVLSGEGCDELFGGYTNILETMPQRKKDVLVKDYVDRIVYDKELWEKLKKENRDKVRVIYKIFEKEWQGDLNYDVVQNWLIKLHLPALLQRLRIIRLVEGMDFHCPFLEPSWQYFYRILPREFRTNKTFLRLVFSRVLPKECLDGDKIGFPLPIDLKKFHQWNIEIWKYKKSDINFWR